MPKKIVCCYPDMDAQNPDSLRDITGRRGLTLIHRRGETCAHGIEEPCPNRDQGEEVAMADPRIDERSQTETVMDGHTEKGDQPGTVER